MVLVFPCYPSGTILLRTKAIFSKRMRRLISISGHSGKMTAHASNRLRDFRARRNGRHRNKLRQNGGNLEIPANVVFLPRLRSSHIC